MSEEKSIPRDVLDTFVHLARISLAGRPQDARRLLERFLRGVRDAYPSLTDSVAALLAHAPSFASPVREHASPVPVDADSRLQLLRVQRPDGLDHEPIWSTEVQSALAQIVRERETEARLHAEGLTPTRTALLVGPPGVGKTMAAGWIAHSLGRPLLTLDLAAVMSSFLGKTGSNLRYVLDYAKQSPTVLLLDEVDSIAKRRDDNSELGELKRLVTVLLQEIDDWPSTGILLAATNHAELLDAAAWRRFDCIVTFPMPSAAQLAELVRRRLRKTLDEGASQMWSELFGEVLSRSSFSDAERELARLQRRAIVESIALPAVLHDAVKAASVDRRRRVPLAVAAVKAGFSQREASEMTGASRDTIRKWSSSKPGLKDTSGDPNGQEN